MNYEEIEYSEQLWKVLFPISKSQGGSLHCTEWTCNYNGNDYRLIECVGDLRSIEVATNKSVTDWMRNIPPKAGFYRNPKCAKEEADVIKYNATHGPKRPKESAKDMRKRIDAKKQQELDNDQT